MPERRSPERRSSERPRRQWLPSPPALVRAFEDAVHPLRDVKQRKMFGYPAVFVNGNMFAGLVRDRMILRLGEPDRDEFLALPGATSFIAMGRRMREWVDVPPAVVKSEPNLRTWLRKALTRGRALPAKGPRRARARK